MQTIAESLADIRARITAAAQLSGRNGSDIKLVAVTKTVEVGKLVEAVNAGQFCFGENYVQEARTKIAQLQSVVSVPLRFDLIGHLQRNKVRDAVALFDLIHTVDRIALAQEISKEAAKLNKSQAILVQVNISNEATKSGADPDQVKQLCQEILELPALELRGLMTIGSTPNERDDLQAREQNARKEFRALLGMRAGLEAELGVKLPEVSMGMSHDFDIAIQEGATMVRVGSAIFGARAPNL